MSATVQSPGRTLSTAEERREDVLRAAMKVVGERGLYGTPTTEIARVAGISQAYLFRLFPTKTELFVAVVVRSYERVYDTMAAAIAESRRNGRPPMQAMGEAYNELLRDPEVLLTERETGAPAEEIQGFFAHGMLCNVMAAMDIEGLEEHWAQVLTSKKQEC